MACASVVHDKSWLCERVFSSINNHNHGQQSTSLVPIQRLLQSDPAITDLENKVSVIAKRLKFKFIRYTEVGLAGGSLESVRCKKLSVITGFVIARSDCISRQVQGEISSPNRTHSVPRFLNKSPPGLPNTVSRNITHPLRSRYILRLLKSRRAPFAPWFLRHLPTMDAAPCLPALVTSMCSGP